MDILLNMLEFLSSMLLIGQVFGPYVKKLYIKRKIMNDQHDIVFKLKQQYEGLSSNEFRELIHGNPYSKYFSPSTPTKLEGFGDGEYYAWNVSKIEVILACRINGSIILQYSEKCWVTKVGKCNYPDLDSKDFM